MTARSADLRGKKGSPAHPRARRSHRTRAVRAVVTTVLLCFPILSVGAASEVENVRGAAAVQVQNGTGPQPQDEPKWYSFGWYEPDTTFDNKHFMHQVPNQDGRDRIYFNAFLYSNLLPVAGPLTLQPLYGAGTEDGLVDGYGLAEGTPVGGTTPARGMLAYSVSAVALLGAWRDCNRDGYIGLLEAGTRQYSADLSGVWGRPVDNSRCPLGSKFNNGGWIDEFRSIGPDGAGEPSGDTCRSVFVDCLARKDPNDISSESPRMDPYGTRVWGDWGHPAERARPRNNVYPLPRGTLDSSYGLTQYTDDNLYMPVLLAEHTGTHPVSDNWGRYVGPWESRPCVGDSERHPCIDIKDPSNGKSLLYPLATVKARYNDSNQPEGSESFGRPLVTVWDCDPGKYRDSEGLVPGLRPGVDPGGSLIPTLEHLGGIGNPAHDRQFGGGEVGTAGACTWGAGSGKHTPLFHVPYYRNLESPASVYDVRGAKAIVDFTFHYEAEYEARPDLPFVGGMSDPISECSAVLPGPSLAELGVPCMGGGLWYSDQQWSMLPPRENHRSAPLLFATFYAQVTPDVIAALENPAPGALPGTYVYGADACADTGGTYSGRASPRTNWHCSPWKRVTSAHAVLGDTFHLRDVDWIETPVSMARAAL